MNGCEDGWVGRVGLLHETVDQLVAPLEQRHAARLRCRRGCAGCCVDGVTVFAVEAARIRARHPDLLREGEPAPAPGCAFLDAGGGCRIYADRPYVCRTQGLPLRWAQGEAERRDICPLNDQGEPVTALAAEDCWTIGPFEARLRAWQEASGAADQRVGLRELFVRQG